MGRLSGSGSAGRRRIAVLHRHALMREGLCSLLVANGFEVVWRGSDLAHEFDGAGGPVVDLFLLDWEAPGVDVSAIRRLGALRAGTYVAIVARPDIEEDLVPVLDAGAVGCLSADVSAETFIDSLSMLLRGDLVVSRDMMTAVSTVGGNGQRQHARLTLRELEILRALGSGATNQEIAEQLSISLHTVKIHVGRILAKMGFRNRQQAAVYANTAKIG